MKVRTNIYSRVVLGCIHVGIGLSLIGSKYLLNLDLIPWLSAIAATAPIWFLFLVASAKTVYGIGSYIPGTTFVLLYFLGNECTLTSTPIWVAVAWAGASIGLVISFFLGYFMSRAHDASKFRFIHLVSAIHPNLAAIYFFEHGFWRRDLSEIFPSFLAFGAVFISLCSIVVCSLKTQIGDLTHEISGVWGLIMVVLGAWRVAQALRN